MSKKITRTKSRSRRKSAEVRGKVDQIDSAEQTVQLSLTASALATPTFRHQSETLYTGSLFEDSRVTYRQNILTLSMSVRALASKLFERHLKVSLLEGEGPRRDSPSEPALYGHEARFAQ